MPDEKGIKAMSIPLRQAFTVGAYVVKQRLQGASGSIGTDA